MGQCDEWRRRRAGPLGDQVVLQAAQWTPLAWVFYQTGGGRGAENNTAKHTAMIKRLVKSDCVFVSCQSVCVSELED